MVSNLLSNCSTSSLSISICIWAWPGSRHRCLVYTPWHYLAVRSYFCHVKFQISIMRLGNASLTIPAALTVLAICDRSKDGRARDGRRYNHNITAVVTNITQQHRTTAQQKRTIHMTAPHDAQQKRASAQHDSTTAHTQQHKTTRRQTHDSTTQVPCSWIILALWFHNLPP